ncbi:MAG: hypothetical protein JXR56_08215 [Candidatus Cloacimonetes bacterium]|nr:hypothetical protein [Candidatus Cloacimonadota bacterium]
MAILYKITAEDNFLSVQASGFDENLQETEDYVNAVIKDALEYKSQYILCDERNLHYSLSFYDNYQLAGFISQYAKMIKKVAIVCAPDYSLEKEFFEEIAVEKGASICFFYDIDSAKKWLSL